MHTCAVTWDGSEIVGGYVCQNASPLKAEVEALIKQGGVNSCLDRHVASIS